MNLKVIAFDADDTLWVNETLFREAENRCCELLKDFIDYDTCQKSLYDMEMKNLPLYGYGIKPFTLSLVEAAIEISKGQVTSDIIKKILDIGKDMLSEPVVLIDGIEDVLQDLSQNDKYQLVVATKGDLLDQERKLEKSGLSKYFHHIEIMSDKQPVNYQKLVGRLDISPSQFLMIGNSVRSDILPVLEMGGNAIHIPFHTTWQHELVDTTGISDDYTELGQATELLTML